MKIRIDEIPPEGLRVDVEEEGGRFFGDDTELRFDGKVTAHLSLHRIDPCVRAAGNAKARVVLPCARCLQELPVVVDSDFAVEYRPLVEVEGGKEQQLLPDELDVLYYSHGVIDIDELVTGQVAESLPLKPLCADACRGLCPQCGQNLNDGDCGCDRAGGDPRLAKLKELLKNNEP